MVKYHGIYPLPKEISVILDKKPNRLQKKQLMIHLKDKAVGCSTNTNFSPFYRAIYKQMADSIEFLVNCKAEKQPVQAGLFELTTVTLEIKGFVNEK